MKKISIRNFKVTYPKLRKSSQYKKSSYRAKLMLEVINARTYADWIGGFASEYLYKEFSRGKGRS